MSSYENVELNISSNSQQALNSLDPTCNELKHSYDACFNGWFTESFLKGSHKGTATPCDKMLEAYSLCVKEAIKTKKIDITLQSEETTANDLSQKPKDKS